MIETKSELLELRDQLGWVDQKDQPATFRMLVSCVMDCLAEIDSLRQLCGSAESIKVIDENLRLKKRVAELENLVRDRVEEDAGVINNGQ